MSEKFTDKMIEDKLAKAINDAAPDMLDDLMAELGIQDDSPVMLRDSIIESEQADVFTADKSGNKAGSGESVGAWKTVSAVPGSGSGESKGKMSFKKILAAAAALLLVFGGLSIFSPASSDETFAVIGLDVNPSIEVSIDDREQVISADAINDDGKKVLDGMSLKGTDAKVACNAILGSMLAKGYLTDTSNSVLVSVRAKDSEKGKKIEEELAGNLNSFMENSEIAAAILGEYVEDDDELEDFAEANGISMGKAWLIRRLLETGSTKMTEQSLLMLSTQDLILLGQEKNISNQTAYGSVNTSKYISRDEALSIAFKAAGVNKTKARDVSVEFDAENGLIIYEVEFEANGKEYEYDINAVSGKIMTSEVENDADSDHDDDDHDSVHDDDDHDDHDDDDHDDHDDDHDDDDHDDHDDDHDDDDHDDHDDD